MVKSPPTSPTPQPSLPRSSVGPTSPSLISSSDGGKGGIFSPVSPQLAHSHGESRPKQDAGFDDGLIPYNAYSEQETNKEIADYHSREARAPEVVAYPYYVQQPPDSAYSDQELVRKKRKRKLLWIILGSVIAIIVIVAAVVGGVVGSRMKSQDV